MAALPSLKEALPGLADAFGCRAITASKELRRACVYVRVLGSGGEGGDAAGLSNGLTSANIDELEVKVPAPLESSKAKRWKE